MRKMPYRASLAVALLAAGLVAGAARATPGVAIDPELEVVRRLASAEELIPVLIVMDDQADVETLLPIAQRLERAERRAFAVGELKHLADTSQGRLRGFLRAAAAQDQATRIEPLWLSNGILAHMTPATIDGLLAFDEIHTVYWDPEIPAEELQDLTEPAKPVFAVAGQTGVIRDQGIAVARLWLEEDFPSCERTQLEEPSIVALNPLVPANIGANVEISPRLKEPEEGYLEISAVKTSIRLREICRYEVPETVAVP